MLNSASRLFERCLVKHIPRKRFGQHFLTDQSLIGSIADRIAPLPGQAVVEIGPGLGALTQPLLERCGSITVIELDRDLAAFWRSRGGAAVIEADVLKVDFEAIRDGFLRKEGSASSTRLRIVGNLPYNISTPILFHLLPCAAFVQDQHFMLQKEVVDRMVARPQTAEYGRLSVMLQWRYAMENFLHVPPEAFDPPPRVQSAVVSMVPYQEPVALRLDVLEELVKVAFSQRRKILRHTLGRWLDDRGFAGEFDAQRRAEEVPVSEFVALAQVLSVG
jgi:16S rRNA (adenine1518-N6/adenine1519-N6)-dimethyltransferase